MLYGLLRHWKHVESARLGVCENFRTENSMLKHTAICRKHAPTESNPTQLNLNMWNFIGRLCKNSS